MSKLEIYTVADSDTPNPYSEVCAYDADAEINCLVRFYAPLPHEALADEFAAKMIAETMTPGATFKFAYPFWGSDGAGNLCDTDNLPDYVSRRYQVVTILRPCNESEVDAECLPQFWFRTADDWEGHADPSEFVDVNLTDAQVLAYIKAAFY